MVSALHLFCCIISCAVFEENAFDIFSDSGDNPTGTLMEKSPFGKMFASTYAKFGNLSLKGTVTKSKHNSFHVRYFGLKKCNLFRWR